jgi:putative FmdB family regulatory protein
MPIYEYECDGCHSVFEVRQKVSDPAPTEHSCGSKQIRRILSATSFVLKGTGWYATDYGNRQGGEAAPKAAAKADAKADAPKAQEAAPAAGPPASGASKTKSPT